MMLKQIKFIGLVILTLAFGESLGQAATAGQWSPLQAWSNQGGKKFVAIHAALLPMEK